jgi:hypothetical protein
MPTEIEGIKFYTIQETAQAQKNRLPETKPLRHLQFS